MNRKSTKAPGVPGQRPPQKGLLPAIAALVAGVVLAALGVLHWRRDAGVLDATSAHFIAAAAMLLGAVGWMVWIRTERYAASASRQSNDTLAAIIDSALDAILLVDDEQRVTVFNPAAEKLFGIPERSAIGRPLSDFLPESTGSGDQNRASMYATIETAIEPAARFGDEGEILARRANGQEFRVEGSISVAVVDGKRYHTVILRDVSELRAAEEARRESEAMLEEAQQIAHVGSWEWRVGSDRVIWSDELYRIHGIPPQSRSLGYEDWLATVHPDDRPKMLAYVGAALTQGTPYETDLRVQHTDGSYRVLHARGRAVLDKTGAVVRLIGTSQDVTAQREAEEARREIEERFSRSFALVGIGMAVASPDGRYMDVNPTLARMLGYEPREMIGRRFREFTHPDDIAADLQGLRETLEGKREHFEREKRYLHRDGHPVWVALSVTLVRDGAGAPSHFVTHVQDISTRRSAEEALQRSEASYRAFVENSPFGIYRSTLEGRFLEVNQAVVAMLGYASADEVLALDITTQVYADPADRVRLLRRNQLNSFQQVFADWKKKDDTVITVRVRARQVVDPSGAVLYCEAFVEDVTPLRAAENALRQAEKLAAVGQLVSGVAHELNNPLSAIMHFVEDLQQDERSPSDREALTQIHDQAKRSRAIVRDLLAFVRDRQAHRERVRCSTMLRTVHASVAPQIHEYGTKLTVRTECADAWLDIDVTGLDQVITNLVINAAQAAGEGGAVSVSSAIDGDMCRILVEDTGPGISADVMPRIFEPFFSTKPTGVGTGLGLAVSLGIVTQLGGTLRAENRTASEGGGARFIVSLPCVAYTETDESAPVATSLAPPTSSEAPMDAATPTTSPSTPAPEPPAALPRVLIIDDEATIRMALTRFFTRRGWSVDEAPEGKTGVDMLLAPGSEYTAIISDLRMPGFSGIDLHDRLERERPHLLDRLIFSTGDVASGEAASFVARTRCPVLLKPFELSTLADAIARVRASAGQDAVAGG